MAKRAHESEQNYWTRLKHEVNEAEILPKLGITDEILEMFGHQTAWTFLLDQHGESMMHHFLKDLKQHFDPEDGSYIIDRLVREYTEYNGWMEFCEHARMYPNWRPSAEALDVFLARTGERADDSYSDGHMHEAQDRVQSTLMMLNELLLGHPAVEKAGVGVKIEQAIALLDESYNQIGQLSLLDE